ncbi:hypothetical protein LTR53_001099 [Teratosphaeriaceae sp. CCFEE 6253]|nr:hypothetical protein LTR53_001099 [Teratosphaeriaceae sp. CCFEE 6253]
MEPGWHEPRQQLYYTYPAAGAQYAGAYREGGQLPPQLPPPPRSSVEPQQTGMQPQYAAVQQPAYSPAAPPYQYHHGPLQPLPMPSNGNGAMIRYPIPQAPIDARHVSGVRGKKEIKRRTKSGCLTCRKRRIKCDEGQPGCCNCFKSKRECLGYDPIFKPLNGPAPIQPAPAVGSAATPTDAKPPTTPQLPPHYPYQTSHNPPATGGPYGLIQSYDGSAEYATSLDPALGSGEHKPAMTHNGYHAGVPLERRVAPIPIDKLFSLNDVPPRYELRATDSLNSPDLRREVADFYSYHYAPGLDTLVETSWYTTQGLAHLQSSPELHDFVADCTKQFKVSTDNPAMTHQIRSLEARLVWQLARMPRSSQSSMDIGQRVDVLENLLTGHFLEPSRIPRPPGPDQDEVQHSKQLFWHHLALFTAARDDGRDPTAHRQIHDSLAVMRRILNMLESRDVLYSIAMARYVGGRLPDFHPQRHYVAPSPDAQDEVNKLNVAVHFVQQEDQKGTMQVIQRVCSMALRAWALQKQ